MKSAGLLLYRQPASGLQVFLVHPGGPFWAHKDLGAWSIPKGEIEQGEEPIAAARREFHEETGFPADGIALDLGHLRQPGGKEVYAWAMARDIDPGAVRSNTFTMEWPPRSGQWREFPEVDRAAWFDLQDARRRILPGQAGFLDALAAALRGHHHPRRDQ